MSFSKGISSGPVKPVGDSGGGAIMRSGEVFDEVMALDPQISGGQQNYGPIMTAVKKVQGMKKGGKVSSASKRADGCAQRGKTRGKIV